MIDDTSRDFMSVLSSSDWIVGIDEVGRGSWAGPLVVGAAAIRVDNLVRFLDEKIELYVDDSKRLSRRRRESAVEIIGGYFEVGIGSVSNLEIDDVGLAKALTEGAKRAIAAIEMPRLPALLLLDGKHDYLNRSDSAVVTIVGGDRRNAVIASASIVAKVHRDRVMADLDDDYPFWNFSSNVGYPSSRHRASIDIYGLSAIHRRSWSFARPFIDCAEDQSLGSIEDGQMILFEQKDQ
ncbi:MAG: ribonuclease HII [Actinomycetota bacterium]|nr:ribonuclease HII [Actinomycetota bacterium]